MDEDAEVGGKPSSTTRPAKNLPSDKAENVKFVGGVIRVMIKRLKNHLLESQTDLRGILLAYVPMLIATF